jgi:uncharacterized membrane protein/mono/diheme cytochrome c family protein
MIVKDPAVRADSLPQRIMSASRTRLVWTASAVLSAALLLLPLVLRLDGKPHSDWQQFLGRFHPLAVHFPVALLMLVPLLEIAGAFRPALREAAGFVLGFAFITCIGALTLGYLLAYGSGDTGSGVTRHMWGGITLCIGVMFCLLARAPWSTGSLPRIYPAALSCVLLLLMWTAHQGGSLTHGTNYLTQYMPVAVKRGLFLGAGTAASRVSAESFYAKNIQPIFDANCVTCHGETKSKGELRLDSYELLMKGGKDGLVIAPGHPETSLLLERVTLPTNHKQFMPAEGRTPLKLEEIALIRTWIEQGASPTEIKLAGIVIPEAANEPPLQPVGDYSGMMAEIKRMEMGQGAKLLFVSNKPSDGLILNTADVSSTFGDEQLAQFQKFAPFIVEAELGRTVVTDASFDTLSKFTHLRALHLEETKVTGNGLAKLASLSQLTYLNLSGTKVTTASLTPLDAKKNHLHLYLYNTPAQPVPVAETMQPIGRKQ